MLHLVVQKLFINKKKQNASKTVKKINSWRSKIENKSRLIFLGGVEAQL